MTFYGVGIRRKKGDVVLDVMYPFILSDEDLLAPLKKALKLSEIGNQVIVLSKDMYRVCRDLVFLKLPIDIDVDDNTYSDTDMILVIIDDVQHPIQNTEDAYFRLQLLSQRLLKPHEQNLDGVFGQLQNIAWTNIGPVLPDDLPMLQVAAIGTSQPITVSHVDKFPYMVDYHVPSGVRIADAGRVRLGAYLSEGTTIMPAGFVNFNAGTLGSAMIEGRISAGVVIGDDSDIGGGASVMGTLSGGNEHVISIGSRCLLGANSGTGISLGEGCTIAAGVYVYAGKKVSLLNEKDEFVNIEGHLVVEGSHIVKARELSGRDYLLFIEDSQTGELICKPNSSVIQLNEALHNN